VPYRAAQVTLLGVRPRRLKARQMLTAAWVVFHHANLRLPFDLECRLVRLIVTPRLHGIHHSIVPEEIRSTGCEA
jgi:sterol desaturase/sphingolipid hydroxylase (fatty acid hydroxylase superfamily)